ncbi:adenosylcobinamide-GDP ribazoletransferase [Ureibacillus chungkukjangi]|uniref:adenosylcobinamide-GDP ribazoletransferase n=1 Tax=Ureibacillus chungkukjangi TaxID=1202712 RepID=UPI00203CB04E|nr:adenosylcobinamide-GDP ribazoletransferase [Ureibacillus chungkukjangi]MCM3387939.1 adenosylcobinamide-GDP ribazoletransferase [Ureibacillus chungkukjangi]
MKNSFIGFLLSFQFFSSLPIRKQLPMNQKTVSAMYAMLPALGILMGGTISLLYLVNEQYLQLTNLLFAILVVIAGIVMTGGLHLDGWIDMGDAYFSYQDKARRLEILEDPRVGAFGAISLVVLVLLKIGFVFELLHNDSEGIIIFFIAVPLLSRLGLLVYFVTTHTIKEKGLAAYFKSQVNPQKIWTAFTIYTLLFAIITYFYIGIASYVLVTCLLVFVTLYRKWTIKNFGGMTGDLAGALNEVLEVFLWGIIVLFI